MPLLWSYADIWETHEFPPWLSYYPATGSKRALSHIRTMCLGVYTEGDEWGLANFQKMHDYMCRCLRILVHARSIQELTLVMGVYNPDQYPPECNRIIKAVNRFGFRILKFVAKMDLRELWLYVSRKTARINDILTIIG